MHASIALVFMMVGGPVFPESDITTIPLRDDLSTPNFIQDQEWQERVKSKPLPRVPTLDDRQQSNDYRPQRYPFGPTDPKAMRPMVFLMLQPRLTASSVPWGTCLISPAGGRRRVELISPWLPELILMQMPRRWGATLWGMFPVWEMHLRR